MSNPLCVITGATSGIGKAAALALAQRGFDLLLLGRNRRAGHAVERRIRRTSPRVRAEYMPLDLTAFDELHRFAGQFRERFAQLNVLVNNAGARFDTYQEVGAGLERTFATNHLGHFLLTALLLEPLLATPDARVVTVGSSAHAIARLDSGWCLARSTYDRKLAYGGSKLANVVFAYELARRLKDTSVSSNAVDPGFVATNFGRNNGFLAWFKHLGYYLLKRQLISPRRGADTIVHLASSPSVQGISGAYFREGLPVGSSTLSGQGTVAADLWTLSVRLVGLDQGLGPAWTYFKP